MKPTSKYYVFVVFQKKHTCARTKTKTALFLQLKRFVKLLCRKGNKWGNPQRKWRVPRPAF